MTVLLEVIWDFVMSVLEFFGAQRNSIREEIEPKRHKDVM